MSEADGCSAMAPIVGYGWVSIYFLGLYKLVVSVTEIGIRRTRSSLLSSFLRFPFFLQAFQSKSLVISFKCFANTITRFHTLK